MSKNILQIIPMYSSAKNFIGDQFSYLQQNGYNMHLICSYDDRLDDFAKKQGIKYRSVRLERMPSLIKDIKAVWEVSKYTKEHKIDLIIAHQKKAILVAIFAGRIAGIHKLVIYAHGAIFQGFTGIKRKILIWESQFESLFANKVVCVSRSVMKLRVDLRIDKPQNQYLLNEGSCGGIDTMGMFNPEKLDVAMLLAYKKQLNIKDGDFVVGFCGRMVKDKGINELIEGFDLLLDSHPDKKIKLLIVGGGDTRNSINAELYEYIKNHKNILLTGYIQREHLCYYYSIMDVIVLPSYREGFGLVTIEAGSMKTPAIVSRSTGCIDSIVENKTGIYCDISPKSIKEQIEYMFDDTVRNRLGENSRTWITENFDNSIVYPYVLKLVESL